ncbi:MAG: hypothetical protein P8L85_22675 [Rubripirellula sp.]|nr:hypothetical protein [Rubripirellula sp.]
MLAPAAQSSVITASGWWPFANRHRSYVGIDIGIDHLEIAALGIRSERSSKTRRAVSLAWRSSWGFELPIEQGNSPPPNWVDLIAERLADRLPRCLDGDRNHCVISLPLPWVHYQMSDVSELDATQQQCDAMFSGSLFQCPAQVRHWPVVPGGEARMVAATADDAASRIAEVVSSVGYQVEAILPHGVALIHAATELTSVQPAAVAILEFSGGLVSVEEQSACGLSRYLPACDLAVDRRPYLDELEPWLQQIASEINATFRYADRLGGAVDPDAPLLLCGRVAEVPGVDSLLANLLRRPVANWRYAGRSRPRCARSAGVAHDVNKRSIEQQSGGVQLGQVSSRLNAVQKSDVGVAVALSLAFSAVDFDGSWRLGAKSK